MFDATKGELLEILGQLGAVGPDESWSVEALHLAVLEEGLTDEVIAAEVAEQRAR